MGKIGRAYCSVTINGDPPLVPNLPDRPDQHGLDQGTQSHERFIQQQNLGLSHEGPADGQHLLLAAAQKAALACFSRGPRPEKW